MSRKNRPGGIPAFLFNHKEGKKKYNEIEYILKGDNMTMKKVFKWFWYGLAGLVVLVVAMTIADDGEDKTTVTVTENATDAAEEGTDDAGNGSKGQNTGKITKAEFEAIESGMAYEEVVEIIGSKGEVLSESGSEGDPAHTVMYQWEGVGDLGANANVTMQGGEVINKAQYGLGE